MKKLSIYCGIGLYSPIILAASIQVMGEGEVLAEPDQVSFSVVVQAVCYSTAEEASASADKTASEIFSKLQSIFPKRNNRDQIVSEGGYTQRTYPVRYGEKANACQQTFQKTTTITVTSADVAAFEKRFNDVQAVVYGNEGGDPGQPLSHASTFVTMNQPTAFLSFDKNKAQETLALVQALQNATEKAKTLVGSSGSNLKVAQISENPPVSGPMMRPMMRAAAAEMSMGAPVAFGNSTVIKNLSVTFEF